MATSKLILLFLTTASSLLASAPATADWKSKKVRHADLDLSTDAGRDRLHLRIKRAVQQVCEKPRAITSNERQDKLKCEQQANELAAEKSARLISFLK